MAQLLWAQFSFSKGVLASPSRLRGLGKGATSPPSPELLSNSSACAPQNLRLDAVLDTLLQTLSHIVPYDAASVILTEENERLLVAREAPPASANRPVVTLEVGDNALLQRVLVLKKGLHLADTREESEWREHKALAGVRSLDRCSARRIGYRPRFVFDWQQTATRVHNRAFPSRKTAGDSSRSRHS